MVDKYEALDRLSKLKAGGVLTDAEFEAEKARVLGGEYHSEARPVQSADRRKWGWKRIALVALVIGVLFEITKYDWVPSGARNTQVATSERLARCDADEVRAALTSALEHSAAERLVSIKVLDVSNIVERSYDHKRPERICATDVTLNAGREHVGFKINPTSDGRNFIVETMDDPGPAPIAAASEDAIPAPPRAATVDTTIAPAESDSPEPEPRELWRLDNPTDAEAAKLAATYPTREAAVDALGSTCGVAATGKFDEVSGWKYNGALCDDDSIR